MFGSWVLCLGSNFLNNEKATTDNLNRFYFSTSKRTIYPALR